MADLENTPIKPNGRFQFRERVFAMLCLTILGGGALFKLSDPENIIINVIVAIAALVNITSGSRKADETK